MADTGWVIKSPDRMAEIVSESLKKWEFIGDADSLSEHAAFFQGFSDATRLKIIAMLWENDLCMCEITTGLNAASSTISHHLKILEKGKVIFSRKEGKFTIYSLNKKKAGPVLTFMKSGDWHV